MRRRIHPMAGYVTLLWLAMIVVGLSWVAALALYQLGVLNFGE